MGEQSWAEYRFEAFGEPYMVWHDGPNFGAFRESAKADPATAERVLLEGLSQGDGLAAQAIAQADFNEPVRERFLPALKEALERNYTTFRVRVAEALTALTGEQNWSAAIVDVLFNGPFWGDRLDAAMALGHYTPTVELIAALMKAVQDEEYLVRYHAANSLLRYAGSATDIYERQDLFAQIANESTPVSRSLAGAALAGEAAAVLAANQGQNSPTSSG